MDLDLLPARGGAVRELGLPLPPSGVAPTDPGAPRLPLLRAGRPLKRWRYVAAFGPDLMLCAGDARIGSLPQRWWAVVEAGGPLVERTSLRPAGMTLTEVGMRFLPLPEVEAVRSTSLRVDTRDVEIDLLIHTDRSGVEPVEVVSRSGRDGWIWTRKLAGLRASGTVAVGGRRRQVELEAVIDDSAGYHERATSWRWSTGVGRAESGARVAWNLVSGVHDSNTASERAIWVDGAAVEVAPAAFADDLSSVKTADGLALRFSPWATREHHTNLLLLRSSYRQPFGTFAGELPGGIRLADGYGVMEEHHVRW